MKSHFRMPANAGACPENIVQGERYRITVLTPGLLRLEYSPEGVFEDRPTRMVLRRDFPKTDFRVVRRGKTLEIHTERLHLVYDGAPFSRNGLSVSVKGGFTKYHSVWRYGEAVTDLGGTARTLDMADGPVPIDHGVISRNGFSVLDDSASHILTEDGWVAPRNQGGEDLYFWGYGHDYLEALRDFYYLCGPTPMLPRYALGNWWSRYYRYSQDSYLALMDRFREENIPFTVAVLDMDWHLVDIDPKYGSGWTGYTWNRALFPDPEALLRNLHARGMRVTLNVHPAEGVRGHEEAYLPMAKSMGVDYRKEDPVLCDPADPVFMENYFTHLHHPLEAQGVDFWWIDWQQGSSCKIPGLDPLWIFNHYHFLDSGRAGKRPLTFSRYAGPGSHRYPVGFSGDTITTWESLQFQPYFTATASNIGYGWWSHDIGGHMMGCKNDELTTRWVQLGVYSPILRLHSSCSEFNGKEPWRYKPEAAGVMKDMLRQRHRLIPYLYTMNHRNYAQGLPLVMPLYYLWPEEKAAYDFPNQYYFGSELMVAPITTPRIPNLNVAKVTAWLPRGVWFDLETGMIYRGGRKLSLYRGLAHIPVLAHGGSILPLTDEIEPAQAGRNPESLEIRVFAGGEGRFTLYEDGNDTKDYEKGCCCRTEMTYTQQTQAEFVIHGARGMTSLIPEKRRYRVTLTGFREGTAPRVTINGALAEDVSLSYREQSGSVIVELPALSPEAEIRVCLPLEAVRLENDIKTRCFDFLNQAEISFLLKDRIFEAIQKEPSHPVLLAQLYAMELDENLLGALMEILTACPESE